MKKETEIWLKKAGSDLDTAAYLFKGNKFEEACLFCQQAVEKALKAVLISRSGKLIKTHDLVYLAGKTKLPLKMKELCKELTAIYIAVRYPDSPELEDPEEKAVKYLDLAKKVLKWAQTKI